MNFFCNQILRNSLQIEICILGINLYDNASFKKFKLGTASLLIVILLYLIILLEKFLNIYDILFNFKFLFLVEYKTA